MSLPLNPLTFQEWARGWSQFVKLQINVAQWDISLLCNSANWSFLLLFLSQICRCFYSSASEYLVLQVPLGSLASACVHRRPCSTSQRVTVLSLGSKGSGLSGGSKIEPWPWTTGVSPSSVLPRAGLAALFPVKFVIADTVLRNQVAPAEEIYAGWIL